MKPITSAVNGRHWALPIVASVSGANTDDFFAQGCGFWRVSGLPVPLPCLLLLLAAARFEWLSRSPGPLPTAVRAMRACMHRAGAGSGHGMVPGLSHDRMSIQKQYVNINITH
jgi:hypothetical protein